jgi:hypothetical protein
MASDTIASGSCTYSIEHYWDQREGDTYSLRIKLPNGAEFTIPLTAQKVIGFLTEKKSQGNAHDYYSK